MTINYDWYTTNYLHVTVYATLIVKATVNNKPFTFNWSEKIGRLYFFLISRTISYFLGHRDKVSKCGTFPDNPGRMACMHTIN